MKNRKHTALLVILAIFAVIVITVALVACQEAYNDNGNDNSNGNGNNNNGNGNGEGPDGGPITTSPVFSAIDDVRSWLEKQPANASYKIKLYIDDNNDFTKLSSTLKNNANKYVYLDLSGSYVTEFPDNAFSGCVTLTEITIPNSITSIGAYAFSGCTSLTSVTIPSSVISLDYFDCTSLTSVTFQGNNTSLDKGFGDLKSKYQSGGAGTYKTTAPVSYSSVWTKQ
jgi:hypothetical protein